MGEIFYLLLLSRNSLLLIATASTIAVLAATILLICSMTLGIRSGRIVIGLAAAFLMVPAYALAGAWSSTGILGDWMSISPVDTAGSPTRTLFAVSWIHAVHKMPLVLLCLVVATQRLGKDVLEQSLLSRSWFKTLFTIYLPLLRPWMLFSWLACSMLIHSDMVISNLYQFETLTEHVYKNESLDISDPMAAIVCVLFAAILALSASYVGVRCIVQSRQTQSGRQTWWLQPKQSRFVQIVAIAISLVLLWLFVFAPLSNLIYRSGLQFSLDTSGDGSGFAKFSLARSAFSVIRAPVDFYDESLWSLQLATWSSMFAITAGLIAAIVSWRSAVIRTSAVFIGLTMLAIPGPLVNRWTIRIFNRDLIGFDTIYNDTLIPCIFALQFRLLPVVMLVLWPAIELMRRRYEDQWRLDFRTAMEWIVKGLGPTLWKPTIVAGVVVFTLAIGDLSSYLLVLPPGATTLAMRIFDLLHYAVRYRDAGLLVFMTLASMTLSFWVTRRFVL